MMLPNTFEEQNKAPEPAAVERETSDVSPPSLKDKIAPPSLKGEDKGDIQLCIVKKGMCQKHGVEARKKVITSKKWGEKKHGYGWIYSRKVEYSCRMENLVPVDYEISNDVVLRNSDLSNKPEVVGTKPGD